MLNDALDKKSDPLLELLKYMRTFTANSQEENILCCIQYDVID